MVDSISLQGVRRLRPIAWLVGIATVVLTAQAQPVAGAHRPDPLDPWARVPRLTYESPFKSYKRLGDEKPVSWREANDTVTRIGGWRAYAREAQQPESDPAKSMPLPPPAVPRGHGDHKMP
jgi:hypothetical protein